MHRKFRTRWVSIVAAIVAASVVARADESLRIVPIVRDNKVLVTFELADAYTEPVRDAIASGLRTTVTYELELRAGPLESVLQIYDLHHGGRGGKSRFEQV